MKNTRGAVLAITVILMFFFTLMGLGALYLSGATGLTAVNNLLSSQAFWLADGGLVAACPSTGWTTDISAPLGNGSYDVTVSTVGPNPTFATLTSVGSINTVTRSLQAQCTRTPPINYGIFVRDLLTFDPTAPSVSVDAYDSQSGAYGVAGNAGLSADVGSNRGVGSITGHDASASVIVTPTYNDPRRLVSVVVPAALNSPGGVLNISTDLTLNGGDYKYTSLSFSSGAKLTIAGHVRLYLTGHTQLFHNQIIINATGASLEIYADGRFLLDAGSAINNLSRIPANFILYSRYASTSSIDSGVFLPYNATLYGVIYAPDAVVNVYNSSTIYGAIVAKEAVLSQAATLHYDQSLATLLGGPATYALRNWQEI